MLLWIGPDRDFEIGDAPGVGDQIGGRLITVPSGFVRGVEAGRRIAPQRHDVTDARAVIGAQRCANFLLRGADAGKMRRRLHRRLAYNTLDQGVSAFAGRTAGAVGHGDKCGVQRLEPGRRLPQVRLHLRGLRREELERDVNMRSGAAAQRNGLGGHQANSTSLLGNESEMTRGSWAIHSTTVSLPASLLAGGTRSERTLVRPA